MSVWKKLSKQDSFVTTYVAKKNWNLSGSDLESAGVKLLPAYSSFNLPATVTRDTNCTIDLKGIQDPVIDTCDILLVGVNTCKINLSAVLV